MLCASEAHEPKNVIHQMHQLRIEQINRLEGFAISIHASAKQCKRLCHGAATAKLEQLKQSCDTYTLTWASKSVSTSASLVGCHGIPKIVARNGHTALSSV